MTWRSETCGLLRHFVALLGLQGAGTVADTVEMAEAVEGWLRQHGYESTLSALHAEQQAKSAAGLHSAAPRPTTLTTAASPMVSLDDASFTVEPAQPEDFAHMKEDENDDEKVVFFQEAAAGGKAENLPMDSFWLRVYFDPMRNALEESVNFPVAVDALIADRYAHARARAPAAWLLAYPCQLSGKSDRATGRQVPNRRLSGQRRLQSRGRMLRSANWPQGVHQDCPQQQGLYRPEPRRGQAAALSQCERPA